ncbi:MAG: hypothetical protein ACYTAO_11660 [Planctomycetota bacterium]
MFANVGAANKAAGLTTLVGAGRMAFAYPDFAKDIVTASRMVPEKVCVSCSACTQIMRDRGMAGCVVKDHKVYGPISRGGVPQVSGADMPVGVPGRRGYPQIHQPVPGR